MVNPERPWPRPETPRAPLDTTDDRTLELWAAQPEWDTRSLEEFASDGGRPEGPPNRLEREGFNLADALEGIGQGIAGVGRGVLRVFRSVAELLVLLVRPRRDDRGRFYELPPPLPRFVPAPCPPSTPMTTGYLRSSLTENERRAIRGGGGLTFPFPPNREDRRALRDELPPVYPDLDDSDDDERPMIIGGIG